MPDDLDHLVGPLRALPLDLDAHDIADALWLAATTGVGRARSPVVPEVADRSATAIPEPAEPADDPGDDVEPASVPYEQGGMFDGVSGGGGRRARQVRIRRPRGLAMPLDLARSLRAFDRKWQAGRRQQLDLDASVAGYARTGRLTPIFRAAPERWFEATVLVDDSPSMALWHETAAEFTALLRQLGAFRSVRRLTLVLDGDAPRVRNAAGRATHPRQLRSSTGRRLVLVLSDCLAEAWSGDAVWRTLWDWARSTPTALVNPLPSSIWRRTGLDLPAVRVASSAIGGANTTLRYQPPWELFAYPTERWLPLPTPTLTALSMRRWANTLMRADPVGADAVLVPPTGRVDMGAAEPAGAASVDSFRHVASEKAFRLAVLSSPHDPVSLRMLDLLRDQLVPDATVSDMAEIIASGVATAERDASNSTVLRFQPGIRAELQRLLPAPEAWRIHEILTDYVATHAGTRGDLVLAVPDPTGTATLPADLQPFADASRSTLRILGIVPHAPVRPVHPLVALLARAQEEDLFAVHRLMDLEVPISSGDRSSFVHALEELHMPSDQLPRILEFAERLAFLAEPPLAAELRGWADREARDHEIVAVLEQTRAGMREARRPRRPSAPPYPVGGGGLSNGGALWPLVRALALLPCMGSLQDRSFVVRLLGDRLGYLQIDESPRAHQHILSIVEMCDRRPDGLAALLDVIRELDEGTAHLLAVERMIAERTSLPLWPDEEREELFALLRGVIFPDLLELYRRIAGPHAPDLPSETTYREVFLTLETLNADPDGLPKPIVFVEHLASGRRSELAIELRRWADRQASRLGVITELQRMRREFKAPLPGPPPNSPAYLVMLIRRAERSDDRFQLCHWHQLDLSAEWRPERGEDFVGSLDEVKYQVAVLIETVETRWARYQPDIRIEFVLPAELLHLDVDQWPWETESVLPPLPVGCRYTVVVRSLERMQTGKWHRAWHSRWHTLTGQLAGTGALKPGSVFRIEPEASARQLVAHLENNRQVAALLLSSQPPADADGGTEVAVGLRAGIPIMIWDRGDHDAEEFHAAVEELLTGDAAGSVLARLRVMRTTAYQSHSGHIGHHLAVVWDDPERLVTPADFTPPAEQGGVA